MFSSSFRVYRRAGGERPLPSRHLHRHRAGNPWSTFVTAPARRAAPPQLPPPEPTPEPEPPPPGGEGIPPTGKPVPIPGPGELVDFSGPAYGKPIPPPPGPPPGAPRPIPPPPGPPPGAPRPIPPPPGPPPSTFTAWGGAVPARPLPNPVAQVARMPQTPSAPRAQVAQAPQRRLPNPAEGMPLSTKLTQEQMLAMAPPEVLRNLGA